MRLYLASASPRRLSLLREAGYDPVVVEQRAPETRIEGESPESMVLRIARAKARSGLNLLDQPCPPGVVLGADTSVVLEHEILGKPVSAEDAREMLNRLVGRRHRVLTGVALIRSDDRRDCGGVETTQVAFRHVDREEIERYVAGGSPLDKAGAYGLQDLDEVWIDEVAGLRSNVVGLPVERLAGWFAELGVSLRS